jgi:hypothetical protein
VPGGLPFEKYYSWMGEPSWILAEEEFAEPGSSTISVGIECHRFIDDAIDDTMSRMTVRLYKYYFPREQGFPPARRSQTL